MPLILHSSKVPCASGASYHQNHVVCSRTSNRQLPAADDLMTHDVLWLQDILKILYPYYRKIAHHSEDLLIMAVALRPMLHRGPRLAPIS